VTSEPKPLVFMFQPEIPWVVSIRPTGVDVMESQGQGLPIPIVRSISPSLWDARLAMDFTLPLGGSRGTSGEGREGIISQLHPSRFILPQRTKPWVPSPLRRSSTATLPLGESLGVEATGIS
jgi:hypothetical protein